MATRTWRGWIAGLALTGMAPAGAHAATPRAPATAHGVDAAALAPAFAEVERWIARGAFPGAVLAVGRGDAPPVVKAFGRLSSEPGAPPMQADTIFDLASLTKVVGTTSAAALLYDRGLLKLDVPVATYLPAFAAAPGHAAITVRALLAHGSGLEPPATPLWRLAGDRAGILALIDGMPVSADPAIRYKYRDENLILIGEIVERLSGEPLDRFLHERLFVPLGMRETGFRPDPALLARIAPTERDDQLRHRLVQGVVHDETAFLMGGVAGHAGLFSTAADLGRFARLYLGEGSLDDHRLIRRRTIDLLRTRQPGPAANSRALGWDMPGATGGFAGPLAAPTAILHTGFTGTSIYIDFARDAYVILLTNRVNPTRANTMITQARLAIHSAVLRALDGPGR